MKILTCSQIIVAQRRPKEAKKLKFIHQPKNVIILGDI